MKRSNIKGFTLIEALIVVIIVGLLAAVGVVKLGTAKDDAISNLSRTGAADVNKGLQRALIANDGDGFTTAVTDGTSITAVINALATAGHFTGSSATELIHLNSKGGTVAITGGISGATTLKALATAGAEATH